MEKTREEDDAERIRQAARSPAFAGRYSLGDVLGRGCAGVVFRADDRETGTAVAIKFLPDSADLNDRFEREASLLTGFAHPNVVRVFAFERLETYRFLVMEFLSGGTLRSRWSRDQGRMLAETIRVVLDCLAGLSACHQRGIVHRDVKPENILFSGDGQVKIADLGIAKLLDDETWKTRTGALMGTPRYMSPEQVTGDAVGPTADIYAVGVILYEALCGRPPFDHEAIYQLLKLQVEAPPPPLDEVAVGVPPELGALVHRALAKAPAERPGSVEEMSAALRRVLEALPPGATARPSASLGTSFDQLKLHASGASQRALRSSNVATIKPAGAHRRRGVALSLAAALTLGVGAATWRLRSEGHLRAQTLALTPDGRTLIAGGDKGDLVLCDPSTARARAVFGHLLREVKMLAVSADGARVAACGDDRVLRVLEVASGKVLREDQLEHKVLAAAFGPDGRTLVGLVNSVLDVWDTGSSAPYTELPLTHDSYCGAFSAAGQRVAVGTKKGALVVADLAPLWAPGAIAPRFALRTLALHEGRVRRVLLSADGRLAVTVGVDRFLKMTHLDVEPPLTETVQVAEEIDQVALCTAGPAALVAGTTKHGGVTVWEVAGTKVRWRHDGPVLDSLIFLDARRLLLAGKSRFVCRDTGTGEELPLAP